MTGNFFVSILAHLHTKTWIHAKVNLMEYKRYLLMETIFQIMLTCWAIAEKIWAYSYIIHNISSKINIQHCVSDSVVKFGLVEDRYRQFFHYSFANLLSRIWIIFVKFLTANIVIRLFMLVSISSASEFLVKIATERSILIEQYYCRQINKRIIEIIISIAKNETRLLFPRLV